MPYKLFVPCPAGLACFVLSLLCLLTCPATMAQDKVAASEARKVTVRATIFGFAMAEHYKALWAANAPDSPVRPPPYRYIFARKRYTSDDRIVVAPNNDTIYAGTSLDLRAEPTVLMVPEVRDRYYGIQFVGIATDDFAYVGTRSTGSGPGVYLIAGPDWKGDVPPGITKVLRSPSRLAIAPMRVAVASDADLEEALKLESGFKLMALSSYTKQPAPPAPQAMEWPPYYDARQGDLEGFLRTLAFMMQFHGFPARDSPAIADLASLGVVAGRAFDRSAIAAATWKEMETGFSEARQAIADKADDIGRKANGWSFSPANAGDFGTDYLTRSAAAWKYIYVFGQEEAVYPTADTDSTGQPLDGAAHRYVIEFEEGALPPAKFFWSLTLYDRRNGFMVANPINRYSIGDRTAGLIREADGSLRLYLQADAPAGKATANWLPAPEGNFYVTLRLYGPSAEVLRGKWAPPKIRRYPQP